MMIINIANILLKKTNTNAEQAHLKAFLYTSVEFCKFKFDDRKDHRDNRTGTQGPPGAQGPQGPPGHTRSYQEQQVLMEPTVVNGTNGVNGTEIDPCVACLLDALVKLDSGAVLVNVTANDRIYVAT